METAPSPPARRHVTEAEILAALHRLNPEKASPAAITASVNAWAEGKPSVKEAAVRRWLTALEGFGLVHRRAAPRSLGRLGRPTPLFALTPRGILEVARSAAYLIELASPAAGQGDG